jgi:hypothetical protein
MTRPWSNELSPQLLRFAFLTCIGVATLISGCVEKRPRAYPWATAIQVRPILVNAKSAVQQNTADLAPNLRLELPPPPSQLEGVHAGPARPGVATHSSDSESSSRDRGANLVPQLTRDEVALAQQQINESLGIAKRNLQAIGGRSRNAFQSDLLSKIVSFMADAHEAAKEGDWTRARNLSKKAQLLSEELLKSY